jgi:hypothetical protein
VSFFGAQRTQRGTKNTKIFFKKEQYTKSLLPKVGKQKPAIVVDVHNNKMNSSLRYNVGMDANIVTQSTSVRSAVDKA